MHLNNVRCISDAAGRFSGSLIDPVGGFLQLCVDALPLADENDRKTPVAFSHGGNGTGYRICRGKVAPQCINCNPYMSVTRVH